MKTFHHLKAITRVEFIPANSASVIIGFAWAVRQGATFNWQTVGHLLALFMVLSAVGTLGAHWNSYSDFELDKDDPTKKDLHTSMLAVGREKLKKIIQVEVVLATAIYVLFYLRKNDLRLVALWLVAFGLAFAYSMPPLRLKARGPLAFASLCLVLSILPMLFVFLSSNPNLNCDFLIFLAGHTMVIYSLIVPTEIRDDAVDRAHSVLTMTGWLGLKKAIHFALGLLGVGTVLILASYFFSEVFATHAWMRLFLLVPLICNGVVFANFWRLRKMIIDPQASEKGTITQAAKLAGENPKWITLSSMGSLLIAIVTLVGKIALS